MPLTVPSFPSGYRMFKGEDMQTLASIAGNMPPGLINLNNLTATTDPGSANDSTQGYGVGSVWMNQTNSRIWECASAAAGAAVWFLDGVVPGVGIEPSNMLTQFGSGAATFLEEGNINRQLSLAGISPGSIGNDNVLAVYTLPANSFDISGRGITITAAGSFGATVNNKTIKLIFNATTAVVGTAVTGGTTIASTGVVATNGGGWEIGGNVFKVGAAGSNTQIATSNGSIAGATHQGTSPPSFPTAAENGPILIALTGNAATATTDIVFNWLEINAMN